MPPLPGGREPHDGSIREEDHRIETVIQGATKEPGGLRRVQRDAGGWLPVDSYNDSTWEGVGATATVDHPSRRKCPPVIQDVLSGKGGAADMPRGGVPGYSGDKEGDAGALRSLACPRHRSGAGGKKLPPSTVIPVQHAGPPEGAERASPRYRTVPQENGKEETSAGRDGDEEEIGANV